MPGINRFMLNVPRRLLFELIETCGKCSSDFYGNVAAICDDHGRLTEEQVVAVLVHLLDKHKEHPGA